MHIFYFYGFASGPLSSKVKFFKNKFLSWYPDKVRYNFNIVDYLPTKDDFFRLKISNLIRRIEDILLHCGSRKIVLFGSSFGGLISTWLTLRHPYLIDRIVLMAPALKFSVDTIVKSLGANLIEWEQNGEIHVTHYRYNEDIPLSYDFIKDLIENPVPDLTQVKYDKPVLIFHGENDMVVPIQWSHEFVKNNPKAILYSLKSDHQLLDQKEFMWEKIRGFLSNHD